MVAAAAAAVVVLLLLLVLPLLPDRRRCRVGVVGAEGPLPPLDDPVAVDALTLAGALPDLDLVPVVVHDSD